MTIISKEEVTKVAKLARINLTNQEQEKFARDLSGILENFKDLSQLDISEVEKVDFLKTAKNQVRKDNVVAMDDQEKESICSQFPQRDANYLKVKAIL